MKKNIYKNKKNIYKKIIVKNKKIYYKYDLIEEYISGIKLFGSEVKSLRLNKANISEAFCQIQNGEIFVFNLHIPNYSFNKNFIISTKRKRKLLLKKKEIIKIYKKIKKFKLTIAVKKIFFSKIGLVKLNICLVKGKKIYDKRETIKKKELNIFLNRNFKKK
ncbi:SsrA-binding protein SmpB [Candidatus Shikimatogenerans silvanidophilus]|uniref:SsrA-binding protein SmpB n=1 Tax=Candidatus Shikimatogenerans silvanidophilus TaxID=2782547 RepID=UPI001BA6C9A9|nr:SsrA-binding protein SmpB [Candidatus Shikimatogenerans silvanidophilus]